MEQQSFVCDAGNNVKSVITVIPEINAYSFEPHLYAAGRRAGKQAGKQAGKRAKSDPFTTAKKRFPSKNMRIRCHLQMLLSARYDCLPPIVQLRGSARVALRQRRGRG